MRTATATSAGGVVVDHASVVLISRPSLRGELQWTLPKGLVEMGERLEDAAVREVREETGLDARIVEPLETIDYWFVVKAEDTRYHKFVHYYLMRPTGGRLDDHDEEVEEARWFSFEDAERACAFENERALIRSARAKSRSRSG